MLPTLDNALPPLAVTATEAAIAITMIVVVGVVVAVVLWQVFSIARSRAQRDWNREDDR